ncbi:MAG TPA: protein kinase, partial [Gemmatimonadaceae bacterium]|nr:protein kinase [Gemmatimonadaceae bacterium]
MDLKKRLQDALGQTYFFDRELGAAGMSRVFLAHDMVLRRKVVIKVLPPELAAAVNLMRFQREVQFAAKLQHPHIVPLLSAGVADGLPYYVMPFIDGQSLGAKLNREGELSVHETVRILSDVLSALSLAHENSVIHRDIKPDNILLTGEHAVVTDFGVAKALSASTDPGGTGLTSAGLAIGTPAYMSPEQSAGDPSADHRSDIYAVGAMAYQMLTGYPVFTARSPQAMFAAHATQQPEPITKRRPAVPARIAAVIMRALEKKPADRPQSAREMLTDLQAAAMPSGETITGVASPGVPPPTVPPPSVSPPDIPPSAKASERRGMYMAIGAAIVLLSLSSTSWYWFKGRQPAPTETPSLAVLPFENLGNPTDAYFADGMTEEISSRLGRLGGLRIIGRQSALAYANSKKSVSQIGKELGVTYVLAGSVRWDRSRPGRNLVRVNPALLRVSDGTQVWSEPSEDELKGVFQLQASVAEHVANALRVQLVAGDAQKLAAIPTKNIEAYDYYLRGKEAMRGSRGSDMIIAANHFERATQLDPGFAQAYAALGVAHTDALWFLADISPDRLKKARKAIDRALQLDPNLPAAHNALGNYYYHGKLDYPAALKEFSIAQTLSPNDAEATAFKSRVERRQGKWDEASADARRAVELDPRNTININDYAYGLALMHQYDSADVVFRRGIEIDPSDWHGHQGRVFVALLGSGNVPLAIARLKEAQARIDPNQFSTYVIGFPWPAYLDKSLLEAFNAARPTGGLDQKLVYYQNRGIMAYDLKDTVGMRAIGDSMLKLIPKKIATGLFDQDMRSLMAAAYAFRGDRERALEEARSGTVPAVAARDAVRAGDYLIVLASVAAVVGANDEAIATFEKVLGRPSSTSRALLRVDPMFE